MTCCEGWTSCNGFTLLVLLLLGITLNAIPLIVNLVDEGQFLQNPISCFEWWFPGIIGAGLMMLLSSLLNVITVIGAVYCMLVSLRALSEGPLICNSQVNSTSSCEFSFNNLRNIHPESFNLQWFFSESCMAPAEVTDPTLSGTRASDGGRYSLNFSSKENKHRTIHFSVFLGLLLVGILELMCGLSQMAIGLLGCLCGVTKRRSRIV
ncbi:transmembrane 4 L6 family member 20 isoform X2 [Acinonyx jubatus]|uniref:Transmembrane 4 L6 family member 20 isoform X2 n=1 Tax=Acinonyx jubatus TaxID=32536 RepID=A0ABM3PJL2_ACIJB|nr:transmembrane 4 L6 family member 20 isoform X2 [Acinonyx jubatus]